MNRFTVSVPLVIALVISSGLLTSTSAQNARPWTALFDGRSLDAFTPVGMANWTIVDGVIQADSGTGFLVTKQPYGDFELRAEFWVDTPANSGIFIRCADPQKIGADTCYEVNIFDTRPDPTYGTGAIVDVAKPATILKAAGQWNTYEISAQGPHLIVTMNGVKTVDVENTKHARGSIGLQYGAGVVKFRNIQIRTLGR